MVNAKDVIQEIAKEAAKLDPLEQQILLTRLRVMRLSKKGTVVIARPMLESI